MSSPKCSLKLMEFDVRLFPNVTKFIAVTRTCYVTVCNNPSMKRGKKTHARSLASGVAYSLYTPKSKHF